MTDDSLPRPLTVTLAILDQTVSFACNGCGHCCTTWQVFVDRQRGDFLLEKAWVQQRLSEHDVRLEPVGRRGYYLPLTLERTCIFLDEDHRCLVEVHEGSQAKPNDCRRFPMAGVPLADGSLGYDVTAACQTVANKLLQHWLPILPGPIEAGAVQDYLTHPSELSLTGKPVPPLSPRLKRYPWPLSGWHRLPVRQYEEKLQQLRQAQSFPDLNPWELLRLAKILLLHPAENLDLSQLRQQASRYKSPAPWLEKWLQWALLRRPYGIFSLWQGWGLGQFHDPKLLGRTVWLSMNKIRQIQWDATHNKTLHAFLYLLISRRIALSYGSSLTTQLGLAMAATVLVPWYARVYACLQQSDRVEQADVVLAIRTVERYYTGHQPRFQGLFDWNPVYSWLAIWAL